MWTLQIGKMKKEEVIPVKLNWLPSDNMERANTDSSTESLKMENCYRAAVDDGTLAPNIYPLSIFSIFCKTVNVYHLGPLSVD